MMVTKIWIFQVIFATASGVFSTELLPERYLKPQNFNHHPFTDVGIPASLKNALKSSNPYAILSKKRPREGREFPPRHVIIYPTPHPSVISRKYIETNEITKNDDPYVNVPKNYAFSYIVKDQNSGDDFSHSQAHNGKATRGEYRVKLPDGRTQIVSYTADHKGYRADVQYEEDLITKPLPKTQDVFRTVQNHAESSSSTVHGHQNYQSDFIPRHVPSATNKPSEIVYTVTARPSQYLPSSSTANPLQYIPQYTPLNLVVSSTVAPQYYQPQYVTTTPAPYVQQQYVKSTTASQYVPQSVPSTPLYPVEHGSANTASGMYHQQGFQNYQSVSSTVSPDHAVIVTPRPAYNRVVGKNEQEQSAPLYYRMGDEDCRFGMEDVQNLNFLCMRSKKRL